MQKRLRKKTIHYFLWVSLLCLAAGIARADDCNSTCYTPCSTSCPSSSTCCRSVFIPRSVGDNLVHQALYRSYEYKDNCAEESCYGGNFNLEYRYQRSRRGNQIARDLFGSSQLHFQGSAIKAGPTSDPLALIADNFGLSPYTDNYIGFHPQISNSIWDFQLYLKLDELWDGLFFQINLPIAKSWWNLHMNGPITSTPQSCSTNCNSSCSTCILPAPSQIPFNNGCMSTVYIPDTTDFNVVSPASSFVSALGGNFLFGDMQAPWTAGHFTQCKQSDTKLASINLILGFTLYECPDYHVGAFVRAAAPTGTDTGSCCSVMNLFSPVIGDNHWKIGAGVTGHSEIYNCDDDHAITVYFEGYVETLLEHEQTRSFDFIHKGCLSRYMLLKEFDPLTGLYSGNLINGINYATRKIKTEIQVQGEGQFELMYSNAYGWSAGIGYNLYGRSKEICHELGAPCDSNIGNRTFGFKGCSAIEGQCYAVTNNAGVVTIDTPIVITGTALNSTESNATIRTCGTVDNGMAVTTALPATGDTGTVCFASCSFNPTPIIGGAEVSGLSTVTNTVVIGTGPAAVTEPLAVASGTANTPQPIFLNPYEDLNICSGLLQSQVTNKLFGHVDYTWLDCSCTPSIRLGGEVEFASCRDRGAMNAWAIYLDGGVAF